MGKNWHGGVLALFIVQWHKQEEAFRLQEMLTSSGVGKAVLMGIFALSATYRLLQNPDNGRLHNTG